nr:carboxypeptidase-like regulatory domain-containing protein [Pedobacter panaciterrae]
MLTLAMRLMTLLLFFQFSLVLQVSAQVVTGKVADRDSRLMLENVEVNNVNTTENVKTNAKGEFSIRATANQTLIFNQVGYLSDTVFLINIKPFGRYMVLNNKFLNTVEITAEAFKPEFQYANVYRKAKAIQLFKNKPFIFYPSKYFSREGKFARRFKRKLEREKTERQIDQRFNEKAVVAVTPLNEAELDYFMVLYRPNVKKLEKMDDDDMKFYLMAAYKEFKALPPEKRVSPSLMSN